MGTRAVILDAVARHFEELDPDGVGTLSRDRMEAVLIQIGASIEDLSLLLNDSGGIRYRDFLAMVFNEGHKEGKKEQTGEEEQEGEKEEKEKETQEGEKDEKEKEQQEGEKEEKEKETQALPAAQKEKEGVEEQGGEKKEKEGVLEQGGEPKEALPAVQ